jgi:hypothetical protein
MPPRARCTTVRRESPCDRNFERWLHLRRQALHKTPYATTFIGRNEASTCPISAAEFFRKRRRARKRGALSRQDADRRQADAVRYDGWVSDREIRLIGALARENAGSDGRDIGRGGRMTRLAFVHGGRAHPREQPHHVIHSDAAGRPPRAPPQAGQICDVPVESGRCPGTEAKLLDLLCVEREVLLGLGQAKSGRPRRSPLSAW